MQVYLILALIFSLGVAVFAVQNALSVDINLFFWHFNDISLVLVILGAALIGATVAGLFGAVKQLKLAKDLRQYKMQTSELQQKVDVLEKKSANLAEHETESSGETQTISKEE